MRHPRSRLTLLASLIVIIGLTTATLTPALAQRRDTVIIGMAQEPDNLIGAFSGMLATSNLLGSVFASMVERDHQGKLFPRVVEKIPTVKDGDWEILPGKKMKVTYRLKRGFTWHDGRPVTALDASWTYLMLRNPRSPTIGRFILRKIDNMLVPDPNTPYTLVVQWITAGPDGILRDAAGKRVELTIMTTAGHALREQIQQIMKEQLRAVGIDLRLDNRPASVFFGVVTRRRQFPHMAMYRRNWTRQNACNFSAASRRSGPRNCRQFRCSSGWASPRRRKR